MGAMLYNNKCEYSMFSHVAFLFFTVLMYFAFNLITQFPFILSSDGISGVMLKFCNNLSMLLSLLIAGYLSSGRVLNVMKDNLSLSTISLNKSKAKFYMFLCILYVFIMLIFFDSNTNYTSTEAFESIFIIFLSTVLIAPIAEEIMCRGYLFRIFEKTKLGTSGAVVITSVIFLSLHINYGFYTLLLMLPVSILFGLARAKTHSVFWSIFMHILVNFLIVFGHVFKSISS